MAKPEVQRRVVFPVGRWDLWAALTRPEELSRWFGAEVLSVEARPGDRIVVRDAEGTLHRAIVETAEAPSRFAFRWLPAAVKPGEGPNRDCCEFSPGSRVEFLIEETDEGSALTVVETPYGDFLETVEISGPIFVSGGMADPVGAPPRIQACA
jgi:uncharacterized protein YndB with AHSA1/START domain